MHAMLKVVLYFKFSGFNLSIKNGIIFNAKDNKRIFKPRGK